MLVLRYRYLEFILAVMAVKILDEKSVFKVYSMKSFGSSWFRIPSEQCLEVALQEEQVFTCHLALPMMPARELAEAVRWELPLHVPFNEEGYHYNYRIAGKSDGLQQVEVFVVSKELVAQYDELAKSRGLVLTALRVQTGKDNLNLLMDAKKRMRPSATKLYNLGTALALGLGVLLLAGSYCYREQQLGKLSEAEVRLRGLQIWQQRFEDGEARQKKLDQLTTTLRNLEEEGLVWSEVLATLGSSMPKDCWLVSVKQKEASRMLEVHGKAKGVPQVKQLLQNLEASTVFKRVSLTETGEGKNGLLSYKLLLEGKGAGK